MRPLAGLTVLMVDDHEDTLEVVALILERSGARVLTASSPDRAIHIVEKTPVDVVVSDIAMPDMDGYDLLKRLRSFANAARAPAAALSAYVREEDRRRAIACGFQTHLAKPVEAEELIGTLASLAGREVR